MYSIWRYTAMYSVHLVLWLNYEDLWNYHVCLCIYTWAWERERERVCVCVLICECNCFPAQWGMTNTIMHIIVTSQSILTATQQLSGYNLSVLHSSLLAKVTWRALQSYVTRSATCVCNGRITGTTEVDSNSRYISSTIYVTHHYIYLTEKAGWTPGSSQSMQNYILTRDTLIVVSLFWHVLIKVLGEGTQLILFAEIVRTITTYRT